ncbi:sex peptide receptor-like [Ruditapes philippinarum]|uniref:sex peptide receptor-like n=1 Tax=Ruditapes philippinarum TaxID=129788 RepID=UPI00295AFF5F|nr:sex peptide receptor-like [Ruditapes philippinarum]
MDSSTAEFGRVDTVTVDEMVENVTLRNISDVDKITGKHLYSASNVSPYPSYYYYYNYNYDEYYFEIFDFEVYALGYVQPILIILTALTNVFVAGYFLNQKNRGKATNLLFVSIAVSDTLTGMTLLPNSFHVYANGNFILTKDWCNAYMILRLYVSPVFHTVSVWQTVLLCIQRYMCVCHPFVSGRICTFWKTFISIIVMYCGAIVLHSYHLVDNKIVHIQCGWDTEIPCEESCVFLWFCVALEHLLPCFLLVGLTTVTIKELRKAQKRMSMMSCKKSVSRASRDKIITYTAVLIVIFFLIPELPYGIYKLVFVIYMHLNKNYEITPEENHIIICVYELVLNTSFSANFWIYCFMMRDFRYRIFKILTCGTFKRGLARLRSMSLSSRGGSVQTTLSRSSSITSRNRVFSRTTSLHSTASDNVHAVIPLTPTRGYDKINYNDNIAARATDDVTNDDVFM